MCQTLFLFLSQNLTSAGGRLGETKTIFLLADKEGGLLLLLFEWRSKVVTPDYPTLPLFYIIVYGVDLFLLLNIQVIMYINITLKFTIMSSIWCWLCSRPENNLNPVYSFHSREPSNVTLMSSCPLCTR